MLPPRQCDGPIGRNLLGDHITNPRIFVGVLYETTGGGSGYQSTSFDVYPNIKIDRTLALTELKRAW